MTKLSMALAEFAEKGADVDVLRELLQFITQRLMEADVEGRCGAGYGERGVGLTIPHFWIALNNAIMHESQGDTDGALRWAAAADRLQPSPALTLEARCRICSILGHEGERHSQRHLAREA